MIGMAYAGYLAWLVAGFSDFQCHRRSDLPHTSGVHESLWHLVQLGLCGTGIVAFLALEPNRGLLAILAALVAAHSVAGFLDTRRAFGRRVIRPVEQHIHSVMDMAPLIATLLVALYGGLQASWSPAWRDSPFGPEIWLLVLGPAVVLCVAPAVMELRAALAAAREQPRDA